VSFTGDGTYSYSLASLPWLTRYDQTRGIYDAVWSGPTMEPELSSLPYSIVTTGANRRLVVNRPYSSAETFQLAAIVRADRYVSDGTSWAYAVTPGLLGDAYQAGCPEEWAVTFGMVQALRQLTKLLVSRTGMDRQMKADLYNDLMRQRAHWAAAARAIKQHEFPEPVQEPNEGLVYTDASVAWS
jgi:hypothetical protein